MSVIYFKAVSCTLYTVHNECSKHWNYKLFVQTKPPNYLTNIISWRRERRCSTSLRAGYWPIIITAGPEFIKTRHHSKTFGLLGLLGCFDNLLSVLPDGLLD